MSLTSDPFVVGEYTLMVYTWVVYSVLCQMINIFGVVTNIINICCFIKHGFKDSVNISLLALSVSDLGSLMTMIWTCISLTPAVVTAELPFDPMEVMYVISVTSHFSFTRVSSCITAMITLDRCLCVTVPLKMKSIVTPKLTTSITICLFIVIFCTSCPAFVVNRLGMKHSKRRNKTIYGLLSLENNENVERISVAMNNFVIPFGAFVIIVICTGTLSSTLQRSTNWRKHTVSGGQIDRVSSRNQKTAKMVVMISILFICCFVPLSIIMLAVGFVPELSLKGKYLGISVVTGAIGYVLESTNASMNIFIYNHMSSKYRGHLRKMFSGNKS